jgi:hypothetical protein
LNRRRARTEEHIVISVESVAARAPPSAGAKLPQPNSKNNNPTYKSSFPNPLKQEIKNVDYYYPKSEEEEDTPKSNRRATMSNPRGVHFEQIYE